MALYGLKVPSVLILVWFASINISMPSLSWLNKPIFAIATFYHFLAVPHNQRQFSHVYGQTTNTKKALNMSNS